MMQNTDLILGIASQIVVHIWPSILFTSRSRMIKTTAKDLRGVAASSRIAEAIIAFACAQNRLPALIPLSSN